MMGRCGASGLSIARARSDTVVNVVFHRRFNVSCGFDHAKLGAPEGSLTSVLRLATPADEAPTGEQANAGSACTAAGVKATPLIERPVWTRFLNHSVKQHSLLAG
jgi:hypothetical protein